VPGRTTLLRPRRCGAIFCLGNPGSCATLGLQPACTGKERTLSATPGFPRIGGPLSTARGLLTVLKAPLLPRVQALVRSSPLADHTLAVAGYVFTVGNWSLPMWRFQASRAAWVISSGTAESIALSGSDITPWPATLSPRERADCRPDEDRIPSRGGFLAPGEIVA